MERPVACGSAALTDGGAQRWVDGVGIILAAPLLRYCSTQRAHADDRVEIDAGHFAERATFVIIVLESIVLPNDRTVGLTRRSSSSASAWPSCHRCCGGGLGGRRRRGGRMAADEAQAGGRGLHPRTCRRRDLLPRWATVGDLHPSDEQAPLKLATSGTGACLLGLVALARGVGALSPDYAAAAAVLAACVLAAEAADCWCRRGLRTPTALVVTDRATGATPYRATSLDTAGRRASSQCDSPRSAGEQSARRKIWRATLCLGHASRQAPALRLPGRNVGSSVRQPSAR
jgi:hypothetical protein